MLIFGLAHEQIHFALGNLCSVFVAVKAIGFSVTRQAFDASEQDAPGRCYALAFSLLGGHEASQSVLGHLASVL